MSTEFASDILRQPPAFLTTADIQLYHRTSLRSLRDQMTLYEDLIARYKSHPFFLAKLATVYAQSNSPATALHYYQNARNLIHEMNAEDSALDVVIANISEDADHASKTALQRNDDLSGKGFFSAQPWKYTRDHRFPHVLPIPPDGHEEVRKECNRLSPDGQSLFTKYLTMLAIETNQIEGTFLLTEGSTQDLVRCGISEEALRFLPGSSLTDPSQTISILNDTLAAYDLLKPLLDGDEDMFDPETICRIHACLMKTDRFKSDDTGVVVVGHTRSLTRKSVYIRGRHMIQCCPFPKVDAELAYICKMANARCVPPSSWTLLTTIVHPLQQWVSSWSRNPFATASWIHLVLVRCHPFEDGNGRLSRLLASIPLMRNGYPPIMITLEQVTAYYDAIREAYGDNHKPFIDCILQGMKHTLDKVKTL